MLYINSTPYPNASASLIVTLVNDAPETVLILSFPATPHDELHPFLDAAVEIVDEQERTISRYTPRICYEIADMDGRTYAKVRLMSHTTTDNPAYYKNQAVAATQRFTDADLARIAAEQAQTEAELTLLEVQHVNL